MKQLFFLFFFIFLVGCTFQQPIIPEMKEGKLFTKDNITLSYNYHQVPTNKAIILVHMLNGNKNDWTTLAINLNQQNFSTLALDLRGHGKSQLDWKDFKEEDFKNILFDLKAAKNFLTEQNYTEISFIGASIGGNIALNYAATDPEIKKIVLLSPSENYRNVTTLDHLSFFKGKLFIATGTEDAKSYLGSLKLYEFFNGTKKLLTYPSQSHGIVLLYSYYPLTQEIITFFKED